MAQRKQLSQPKVQNVVYFEENSFLHFVSFPFILGMLEQWQTACDQLASEDSGVSDMMGPPSVIPSSTLNLVNNAGGGAGSYDHLNGAGSNIVAGGSLSYRSNPIPAGFDTMSDKDSVSLHAHSITASHVEKTLSEVASSLSSPFPRPGPQDPTYTQMRIWLLTAELHLRQGNIQDAEICVTEARQLSPLSYHLMYMRGMIHEYKREYELARQWFDNSLGINPTHVSSLHHLGLVNHYLGFERLAEQSLKGAVRIDPNNEELWSLLGEVKEAIANETLSQMDDSYSKFREETERTPTEATSVTILEEATRMFKRASECQAIALALQKSSPILPFTTIPLCFE